jgi:DNA invertase Pin-like site-specific DNA recombinase
VAPACFPPAHFLEVQLDRLQAAGADETFRETRPGLTVEGRQQLEAALRFVRKEDVFLVTRLDRLARFMIDLRKIVHILTWRRHDQFLYARSFA